MPVRERGGQEGRETWGRSSSRAPGAPPPGQSAGTLALDCLLPGPPSVTVSSHGHRRLAPPQDLRPGRQPPPPGVPQPCAAAVRGADPARRSPRAVRAPGPRGLRRPASPHARSTAAARSPPRARARRPAPAPLPRGPDVSLLRAAAVPSAARTPPPRLQGNRGFRLLLWEPEVTVYSHGRPAARPRAAPLPASLGHGAGGGGGGGDGGGQPRSTRPPAR